MQKIGVWNGWFPANRQGAPPFTFLVRALSGLLLLVLCLWILAGTLKLGLHLYASFRDSLGETTEHMVVSVVTLLAVLELVRVVQSYLELGRVRVTFILDVALVVLIGELIGLWYRDYTPLEVLTNVGVITALSALRIVTVKYSPENL